MIIYVLRHNRKPKIVRMITSCRTLAYEVRRKAGKTFFIEEIDIGD